MKPEPLRTLTRCAALTALALAVSLLENLIPLPLPVPGVKLGLANAVTLFLILYHRPGEAGAVLAARVLLGAFFAGSVTALLYSAVGGAISFCVTLALRPLYPRRMSAPGLSVAGAAAHNLGQICAAALVLGSGTVFAYLPVLLVCAVVTGALTGTLCSAVYLRLTGAGAER